MATAPAATSQASAKFTADGGQAVNPCDPEVMGADKQAAEECFKKKSAECAKGMVKGMPSPSGNVDQECLKTVVSRCADCAANPNADACMMCVNASVATCTTLPSISVPFLDTYRACMTASVAGLGTAFLTVWDDIYDLKTQVDAELQRVGCTPEGDTFICDTMCNRTNSCLNANDPINGTQRERCDMCQMMCRHNRNYCRDLSLE